MITNNLSTLKINKLTQGQYDRVLNAGDVNSDELYLTPDIYPDCSSANNGQFLRVVNGMPTWVTIDIAEEMSY